MSATPAPTLSSRTLRQVIAGFTPVEGHRPWPRVEVDAAGWRTVLRHLASSDWSLLGLWAEADRVHLALRDGDADEIAIVSHRCLGGDYAAVSPIRPAAQRLERAIADLFGLRALGGTDGRPWLDHGCWPVAQPLAHQPLAPAPRPIQGEGDRRAYEFLPAVGEGLHQIPVGPVHAGIIEPGHFRFHANGETVVRLEARLGYTHKGTESLMAGRPLAEAAKLAARISGDSTVAHSLGFARAAEAALGIDAPPRACWLRGVMAELERLANHFGDIGGICNDASFGLLQAHLATLREQVLRAAAAGFGHRLMMDRVIPGGVAVDLDAAGRHAILQLVADARPRFAELVRIYDHRPSLDDRMIGTGRTDPELVRRFGAGGFIGRAAGGGRDARVSPGYPPYDELPPLVPGLREGDVNARVWIRIREVETSLDLLARLLDRLPAGRVSVPLPSVAGEGMALVEGFRGEILTWLRVDADGRVVRAHARDPSWFQWPLLEAAIEGNIVADFPLCNKSFNCSYSGHDL